MKGEAAVLAAVATKSGESAPQHTASESSSFLVLLPLLVNLVLYSSSTDFFCKTG